MHSPIKIAIAGFATLALLGLGTGIAVAQTSQPTAIPAGSHRTPTPSQMASHPRDANANGSPAVWATVPSGLHADAPASGLPTPVPSNSHPNATQLAAHPGDLTANGASPTSATDTLGCPAGYACAWVNAGFSGGMGEWAGNNADWYAFPEGNCYPPNAASDSNGTWYDCASSIDNDGTQCDVTMYRGVNYTNGGYYWAIGQSTSNLSTLTQMNDNIKSNSFC